MPNALFICLLAVCLYPCAVRAQSADTARPEETEPRIIGRFGTTWLGFSGYADRFFSSEDALPTNYTAQVEVCRFVTERFVVRIGAVGSGRFGGEMSDDASDAAASGSGAPSMHVTGGVLYYFTPRSILSAYLGAEYWAQLTERSGRDTGSVLGIAGVQAAVSSRASFYIQGGIGTRVNRGDENELLTRFVAQVGLRLRM
jgi:predicted porin